MARLPDSPEAFEAKGALIAQADKVLAGLRSALKEVKEGEGNASLHRMRVSIKKLRAILSLCEVLNVQSFSYQKEAKAYSVIFKPAGDWRDWLNIETRLMHYQAKMHLNIETLANVAHYKATRCSVKYLKKAAGFNLKVLDKTRRSIIKTLAACNDLTIQHTVKGQLMRYLDETADILSRDHNPEHLHDIRKILKSGWYIRGFLPQEDEDRLKSLWGADMRHTLRHLGDFQDAEVLQTRLNELAKNRLVNTAIDKATLEKLNVRIFADKARSAQKAVAGLEKILERRT